MKQLKQGKKVEHYETERKAKDGRILDVSITVSPIRNADGVIIGASKVARDITGRKQTEERQNFLERVSTILNSSIDYETTLKNLGKLIIPYLADYCRIVVVDDKKQIKEITVNHVDRKKLPLVRELYTAYKNDHSSGVGKLLESGKAELMQSLTAEMLESSTSEIRRLVKTLHLQSYMGVPMLIRGRVIGAITFSLTRKNRTYIADDLIMAEELARRAALAIENARLYAEAQNAIMLRDEFISVASHELKTPLTSLKIYTRVMMNQLEKHNNSISTKPLVKMDVQISKLTNLINDLLNVSKVQTGKLEFNEETFDINSMVKDTIEYMHPTAQKHKIILKGSIKKTVFGDKDRIGQVLTNLITNAIKYSPKADKVVVQLTPEKNAVVVSVQDFGIGIDKEHQRRIFERFYRVNNVEEKTFPGLGLGLYISYQIIKRHGGKMSVMSSKGKGSKFSFTLPYSHEKQNKKIVTAKKNSASNMF